MLPRKKSHHFSVVLPLYNPSANWEELFLQNVKELNDLLSENVTVRYIVVYDGLPEESVYETFQTILQNNPAISFLPYAPNMGKGYALRRGVSEADTDYIIITDFDFPYAKRNIVELIDLLVDGYDVVVGKRSESYFRQLPFKRKIISQTCNLLKKAFLDLPSYDTQSGIKAFNKNGKQAFLETTINRFLIDTEFLLRSHKKQLAIKEINIELESYVRFSNFGLKVLREEMNNFFKLLHLNKKLRKGIVA
jgi:glycosyltransferase involved in cell wall biosynthesis